MILFEATIQTGSSVIINLEHLTWFDINDGQINLGGLSTLLLDTNSSARLAKHLRDCARQTNG